MSPRAWLPAAVAGILLLPAACGGSAKTAGSGAPTSEGPRGAGSPTTAVAVATTLPCPTKAVVVTRPGGWSMVDDFFGQQNWQATATVTNPNAVDIQLAHYRSFALADVVLQTGTRFSAYTGEFVTVLPSGGGLVLAGRTIDVVVSMTLTRPASITTTDVFADFVTPSGVTDVDANQKACPIPVTGAKRVSAAMKGPRLCGRGDFADAETKAAIGIPGPSDRPSCG